jgi:hypothetical protein
VIALSAMFKVATRLPLAAGLNVTLIVQLAPVASVASQVVEDWAKSLAFVPLNVFPDIVNAVGRLFFTMTTLAGLVVPAFCAAKVSLDGVTLTGAIPVPVRLTVWGLLVAVSVIVSVALFDPGVTGSKLVPILQDE